MKDLQKLVKSFTNDEGQVDWAKIEEAINSEENALVAKAETKGQESGKNAAITEFYKKYGFEDASKFEENYNAMKASHNAIGEKDEAINNLTKTKAMLEREKTLYKTLGKVDEDKVDYVLFNVNKRVNEEKDFETAFKEFQAEKPEYFKPDIPTFTTTVKQTNNTEKLGFEKVLEDKHSDLKL